MQRLLPWGKKSRGGNAKSDALPVTTYLHRVNVFRDLTHEEVEQLGKSFAMRECFRGMVFFTPEDTTERLFILKRGQVELYRLTLDGKRLVTQRIGPGAIFGEMGLLGQSMQGCFAEALEDSLVCSATREDVVQFFRQHPDVGLRMLEAVGTRLKVLETRLELAAYSPVKVRLANFLMTNADPVTGMIAGFTHAEIGDTIGAGRQAVTLTLKEMEAEGMVAVSYKRVRVTDRQALRTVGADQGDPG